MQGGVCINSVNLSIRGLCVAAPYDLRRSGIFDRGWAQTIEAENGFVVGIVNRRERFRAAQLVALAGVTAQEFIQRFFAAVGALRDHVSWLAMTFRGSAWRDWQWIAGCKGRELANSFYSPRISAAAARHNRDRAEKSREILKAA
jgi:hypothetical protein